MGRMLHHRCIILAKMANPLCLNIRCTLPNHCCHGSLYHHRLRNSSIQLIRKEFPPTPPLPSLVYRFRVVRARGSLGFDIVQGSSWACARIQRQDAHLIWWHLPECTSSLLLAWGSCVSSPCHGVIRPYTGYAVCSLKSPFQNHKLQNNVVLEV